MEPAPVVSVIMPAYNSAAFISEAIDSVLQQSYTRWELIVIDDGSIDSTVSIVENFSIEESRIRLIKQAQNKGPGVTRNIGIEAANGDYIAFLDSDDMWLPHKLEIQMAFMKEHDLEMSFSSYLLMDEEGNMLKKSIEALPVLSYSKLLKSNYVGNLTAVYNIRKTGKIFAPTIRKRQDWALWLTIVKKFGPARGIKEPLAIYRIRKASLSGNKYALVKHNFRIYREFLGLGRIKSSYLMGRFLFEHFFVKSKQEKVLK